jgi:pyruvate dehydrogenase E2 component (dihydrolipoamide acetyltransferase)
MSDVTMPRLSDSMEEGLIVRWLRADGQSVARDEELVEIETDKATMVYESPAAGTLQILAAEGSALPVGAPIARLDAAEHAGAVRERALVGATIELTAPPTPAGRLAATPRRGAASTRTRRSPPAAANEEINASPLARRIARELGVELAGVHGSGPHGRISKADVAAAAAASAAPPSAKPSTPASQPSTPVSGAAKGLVTLVELSPAQEIVARRMAQSRAAVPDFTLQAVVDATAVIVARSDFKAMAAPGAAVPSLNDMVVKACGLALRECPRANGSFRDGHWELYSRINVGIAVAVEDSLVVPTLLDADLKSLGQIALESRALVERVRAREIAAAELASATFTVSNLGMFGVETFSAVINPPQSAILAVGAARAVPVVRDGVVVAGHEMRLSLTCDHRILYGADAAQFLASIVRRLEHPISLAL